MSGYHTQFVVYMYMYTDGNKVDRYYHNSLNLH